MKKRLVVYNSFCLLEEEGMPLYGREKWDGLYIILQIITIQVIKEIHILSLVLVLFHLDICSLHYWSHLQSE